MMNDRFSVELRQHLLATADERPGDGRLAAIGEGVAVTGQRHPVVTRLPWSPARLSPLPSRAMRYGLLIAALIVGIVGAAMFAVGQAGRTPFQGTWTSIDPGDGSTQTLVVGAGASPTVRFQDEIATGGACVDDPIKLFTADGTGTVTGNQFDTSFPDGGGCGSMTVEVHLQFVYDDRTDSLRDQDGVDWVRARGDRSAVPSPTTEPSVATPEPSDTCVQFEAPTTYTAPAGSMSVLVSVPGTAQEPWLGEQARFNLLRAACTDMSGQGYIEGREVARVYTDGCATPSVAVDSTAEAIAAVSAAKNLGVVRSSDVSLGGYEGTRFDILVPEGLDACPDHQIPVVDGLNPFDAGVSYALYLIDVDGKTLALALFGYMDWGPDVTTAVDQILDSMQIDPTPTAPTPTPTSTEAPSSPAPTPHPGETTFTSAINGFSMGVPKGWQTRAATQAWDGEPLDFDSPAADVIFDPATKDGLYLVAASRAFSDMSGDEWRASVLQWTCVGQGGHEFWGWRVDGIHSEQFGPCNSGSIIQADTRGYLFRLVSPRAEKLGLSDTWDSLKPMLETVDLRPDDAVDPPGTANVFPPCAEIGAGDTYTNAFGGPKLSATVPAGAKSSWQGSRDDFELRTGACPFGGSIWINASSVETVLTDPCDPTAGVGGNVSTAAEAADAMAAHIGHRTSESTEITIDGRDGLRLEISTEGSTCTDPFSLWPGTEVNPGQDAIIHLVDVGADHPLGIGVWYSRNQTTPAQIAEAEAIVGSIQIPA